MENISRREFNKKVIKGLAGIAAMNSGVFSLADPGSEKRMNNRPNFIFITSDQHNANCTGYSHHPLVKTPNLDRIAGKGVSFSNAYTGSPLCAPGRSSLMTGMYSSDVNSFCNSTVYDGSYPTWGKRLKDSGYYCWATGKQDMNPAADMGFTEVKVDHEHSSKPDITSLFRKPGIYRLGEREGVDGLIREERHADMEMRDLGIDFIRNGSKKLDRPWACFIGFHLPHPKFIGLREYFEYYYPKIKLPEVSEDYLEKLPLPYQELRNFKRISTPVPEERKRRALAAYFSMISEMDEYIGQIYDSLKESGQSDNTYFIYTSDHGESMGEHGLWYKNNLYDCASRIPLIMTGPDISEKMSVIDPVGHVDLTATILDAAGISDKTLRGISLFPLLRGNKEMAPEFVYAESHSEGNPTGSCMIRKGDWKLIHFSYFSDQLFDLKNDPEENIDLSGDPAYSDIKKNLLSLLYSKVDPEQITRRAFELQSSMLKRMVMEKSRDELIDLFKGRMGEGQARIIVNNLKGWL